MTLRLSVLFAIYFFILAGCSKVKLKGMKSRDLKGILVGLDEEGQAEMVEDWLRTRPAITQVMDLFDKPGLAFPSKKAIFEDKGMMEECKQLNDSNLLYWVPAHLDFDLFVLNEGFSTATVPLIGLRSDESTADPEFKHALSLAITAKYILRGWRGRPEPRTNSRIESSLA